MTSIAKRLRRAVIRGGLENLWRRPFQYRPVPVSHSAPRVAWPLAGLRPLISLRLPARLGPKLGPTAMPAWRSSGGVDFRSLAPTEGESATPVRRPGAVIVTHDGLGFAVAECDEVGGHRGFPFDRGGVSIRHTEP